MPPVIFDAIHTETDMSNSRERHATHYARSLMCASVRWPKRSPNGTSSARGGAGTTRQDLSTMKQEKSWGGESPLILLQSLHSPLVPHDSVGDKFPT